MDPLAISLLDIDKNIYTFPEESAWFNNLCGLKLALCWEKAALVTEWLTVVLAINCPESPNEARKAAPGKVSKVSSPFGSARRRLSWQS